ncbi:undecaprenyl-diphosphate phosphatase [Prochlorococcus marinus]|uniref:undecaprenyl-diphosphate phosphatase n=1 Tax=Prochlorococcus marinus TaxID=1219 RepID=UPI0022B4AAD3|nr:undecaprenyl-diphosphate phosphatase [Prochlorococcus marinus]
MSSFIFFTINASNTFFQECWKSFFLGIIQGITEFIPISSTAHLMIFPALLGWEDPGVSISASLQLGSIIALITYFWSDIVDLKNGFSRLILQKSWNNRRTNLFSSILIGSLPIIFVGGLVKLFWSNYENSVLRTIPSVAIVSILMAILLFLAELFSDKIKTIDKVSKIDGFFIGCAQVLALIPGVSRSGITITTALITGLERESAARFSFLLGLPAITLAGLVELKGAIYEPNLVGVTPLLIGICSSAFTSYLSIGFLMRFLQKNNMMIFITYRLLFGTFLLAWYYINEAL